jgi:hypothetical protein
MPRLCGRPTPLTFCVDEPCEDSMAFHITVKNTFLEQVLSTHRYTLGSASATLLGSKTAPAARSVAVKDSMETAASDDGSMTPTTAETPSSPVSLAGLEMWWPATPAEWALPANDFRFESAGFPLSPVESTEPGSRSTPVRISLDDLCASGEINVNTAIEASSGSVFWETCASTCEWPSVGSAAMETFTTPAYGRSWASPYVGDVNTWCMTRAFEMPPDGYPAPPAQQLPVSGTNVDDSKPDLLSRAFATCTLVPLYAPPSLPAPEIL